MKLAAALLLAAALPASAAQRTVKLATPDGCALEAFYLAPSSGALTFVNVHGLGSGKYEWDGFQKELKASGYGYLSLDLRGHGESSSCGGKKAAYMYFSGEEWNKASLDVETASAWLKGRGIKPSRQVFCGASIGANLVMKAAAEGAYKPAAVVMLSPGLEYAGVKSAPYFAARRAFPVLTAASPEDGYAWFSAVKLNEAGRAAGLTSSLLAGKGGHGVNMFTPEFTRAVLDWAAALK